MNSDEHLPQRSRTDGIGRFVGLAVLMIVLAHVAVFAGPWPTLAIGGVLMVALLVVWQVSARRSRRNGIKGAGDVKGSGSPRLSGWPERWDR